MPDKIDENKLREPAEHIENIGPEDEAPEDTMQNLEEEGFAHMDDGLVGAAGMRDADQPDWADPEKLRDSNVAAGEEDDDSDDTVHW